MFFIYICKLFWYLPFKIRQCSKTFCINCFNRLVNLSNHSISKPSVRLCPLCYFKLHFNNSNLSNQAQLLSLQFENNLKFSYSNHQSSNSNTLVNISPNSKLIDASSRCHTTNGPTGQNTPSTASDGIAQAWKCTFIYLPSIYKIDWLFFFAMLFSHAFIINIHEFVFLIQMTFELVFQLFEYV